MREFHEASWIANYVDAQHNARVVLNVSVRGPVILSASLNAASTTVSRHDPIAEGALRFAP